jgi:cytochrome c oxidase subunit 2
VPAVLALAALSAPAHASILDPTTPHSPNAHDMTTSYWVMLAVVVVLAVVVNAALIVALVRFRERRDRRPPRLAAGRGVVPRAAGGFAVLAIVVLVFGVIETQGTRSVEASGPNGLSASKARFAQVGLRNAPPLNLAPGTQNAPNPQTQGAPETKGGPVVIAAIAQQWLWRFEYPGNNPQSTPRFTYGELVVPVDTTVILNITSTDVMHTWWVPSLGGQVQAVPGTVSQTWFKADQEGTFRGASTSFSGTSYPALRAWVKVVSPEAYQAYVEDLQKQLLDAQGIVQKQVSTGTGPIGEVSP